VLFRLEMQIRCALRHRVGEQRVNQPDHGLASIRLAAGFDFAQQAVDRKLVSVMLADRLQNRRFTRAADVELHPTQQAAQLVEQGQIVRVGERHGEFGSIQRQRQSAMAGGGFFG